MAQILSSGECWCISELVGCCWDVMCSHFHQAWVSPYCTFFEFYKHHSLRVNTNFLQGLRLRASFPSARWIIQNLFKSECIDDVTISLVCSICHVFSESLFERFLCKHHCIYGNYLRLYKSTCARSDFPRVAGGLCGQSVSIMTGNILLQPVRICLSIL